MVFLFIVNWVHGLDQFLEETAEQFDYRSGYFNIVTDSLQSLCILKPCGYANTDFNFVKHRQYMFNYDGDYSSTYYAGKILKVPITQFLSLFMLFIDFKMICSKITQQYYHIYVLITR